MKSQFLVKLPSLKCELLLETISLTQFQMNPYRDTNEPHTILFYFITEFGIVTFVLASDLTRPKVEREFHTGSFGVYFVVLC